MMSNKEVSILRSKLSAAQHALLEKRLRGALNEQVKAPVIPRRAARETAPLSFAQQRLWLVNELEPDSPAYNVAATARLDGRLDIAALKRTFEDIVSRHESLRTTFAVEGQPLQIIAPAAPFSLPVVNLEGMPAEMREAEAHRLAKQEMNRGFDLRRDALLRVMLLRLAENEHRLIITMHHIVSDAWSTGVLIREVASLYEAFCEGKPSPLPELPIQYADFAQWQRETQSGEALAAELAYWKQQLAGAPTVLELPSDHARPARQSFRGANQSITLPAPLVESLKTLGQRQGLTLYMTLLAAFKIVLSRYTGQLDIVVGSPIANRTLTEIEPLIGFFVNTLVMRTDFAGDPTLEELLARVRDTCQGAYSHQHLPFEQLVEALQPERDASRSPLVQVMISFQNTPRPSLKLPGLTLSVMEPDHDTAKFDLTLLLEEADAALVATLEYSTDLFEAATIKRLLGHFQEALKSLATNPRQRLSEVDLLTTRERQELLFEWSGTPNDYPHDLNIHGLFERQAAQTPDAVAVVFGEKQLTYDELNGRANQLARHLRSRGVGLETMVGICAERSVELLTALLAILKAGAAYVPLDPSYPQERLRFMLEDTQTKLVLTQRHLVTTLPACHASLICLEDPDLQGFAEESAENLDGEIAADNLAYVIYTSGSTGRPKGVGVPHRGVVRLVRNTDYAAFNADETFLQLAPISFDASTFEIWGSLLNGARLVVMPPESPSLEELGRALRRYRVTTLWLTANLFHLFVDTRLEDLVMLRQLLAGGDTLSVSHVERFLSEMGECRLINGYGPTENTTFTCCHTMTQTMRLEASVPIGRPIANTHVYILDEQMRLAGIGIAGELFVGGDGLARGYLNRPDLTAEKFVPDPFSRKAGARLYRTGDLVRWLADGTIEFLGRRDHQVKLRGFRIELGEIEAALKSHAEVREALIMAREDVPGDKRLVAYVVAQDNVSDEVLRDFLSARLPKYMLPTTFIRLEAFPLTPNGKVDRRSLPAPDAGRGEFSDDLLAPRNQTEELLAGIWSDLLGVGQVGVNHNFFELGGHSLLATRLVTSIREGFGVELTLRSVFEAPTLAALAKLIESARRGEQDAAAPRITRAEAQDSKTIPLSFAQQRLWFLNELEPDSPSYNIPFALHLEGLLDASALRRGFDEIIRRHEILRSTFTSVEGEPVQIVAPEMEMPLAQLDLSGSAGEEQERELRRLSDVEAHRPFDHSNGPLLRALLVRLHEDEHVLFVTIHHIVFDGWSIQILMRELSALYETFSNGKPSRLSPLPIQYGDFARWQRRWFEGATREAQLDYWKKTLTGASFTLDLFTDHARPSVKSMRGARQTLVLPEPLTTELLSLSRRRGVTLYMTLLAAFQTLLARYTQQEDLLIGTPVANRARGEVEGLIGFFVNTLILRTDLSGNPRFSELLGRVREVALGAYAHQDLPFEVLVEELLPERDLSRSPLFQVMFALQNTPPPSLELANLKLSLREAESKTAKFDISLFAVEAARRLTLTLEYSTDLFDASTISRMLENFQMLLASVATDDEQRLSSLRLLSPAERQQVLEEWNTTTSERLEPACLHELFELRATLDPEAVAAVFESSEMTYGDLNRRANQLAHHLRSLGIGPDARVGLCIERSLELAVGVLGILKAGGAYVPLDPAYPQERISFMLEDARAQVLVTQERLLTALSRHGVGVVCLDRDRETIERMPAGNLSSGVRGDNLAYVIYTSGSTGRPKGAALSHFSLTNLMIWQVDNPPRLVPPKTLQFSPLSFDVSCQELFSTWYAGGTVVFLREDVRQDSAALLSMLEAGKVERLFLPFVALQHLAEVAEGEAAMNYPREIITAGEQLQMSAALRKWLGRLPGCRLYNHYGPSESHVVTSFTMDAPADEWPSLPPIGRPIANTQMYVLDRHLNPQPIGAPGDLYIGGVQLARGYIHQPRVTAERFLPNPFARQPGARMYQTGDLARFRADGQIEFLGRVDQQVKVRGFRIELGEIETTLGRHPSIAEAVVVACANAASGKRLVAYVVPVEGHELGHASIKKFLEEQLPEYMIPSIFILLDTLPLTPSGKINRRALPEPDLSRPELETSFVAPRNQTEELLAGVWADILGVEGIGIHDNFFALGGHSLLATRVISKLRALFGVHIPLRSLFELPTVASLAGSIEAMTHAGAQLQLPPITCVAGRAHAPLSYSQRRLWLFDQLMPGSAVYNLPAAIRFAGALDASVLEHSLNVIVHRHETLRTTFTNIDEQPVQVVNEYVSFPLPVRDLQQMPESEREAEVKRLVLEEASKPFDLTRDAMMRATLLRSGADEHVLLLTIHHIAADGWSVGVLVNELSALYKALSTNAPVSLPMLSVQYSDFAAWQREWLTDEHLESQLSYWRGQLAGVPPVLELPFDRLHRNLQTSRGAHYALSLSENLTQQLKALGQREGATLFMTLLAGFATLLGRYSGQHDLVIGTPIAGRTREETEPLIGFFTNTLVLRADLDGNPSFRQLMSRMRETCLGAYAHQELPFERLVEELQPERDMSRSPLFQVMFVLQNAELPSLELPELTLSPIEFESGTAKFDLTLSIEERAKGLNAVLEYNTDLFDASTIERMAGHFLNLLQGAAEDAGQTLAQLPLLTGGESRRLLHVWNDTDIVYPHDRCFQELFEAQVERSPDAIAVSCEERELSYGELNRLANRMAYALVENGVEKETLVALLIERNVDFLVSMLAVFKAGGAYLPLEPSYPAARIMQLLKQSGAPLLLTTQQYTHAFASEETASSEAKAPRVLHIEDLLSDQDKGEENLALRSTPDALCYVIYTSGSTGLPKGAMVEHKGMLNHLYAKIYDLSLAQSDLVAQTASQCFDISVWQFLAVLLTGGRVRIFKDEVTHDPVRLLEEVATREITILETVPSLMRLMIDEAAAKEISARSGLSKLRWLIPTGEALPPEMSQQWLDLFSHVPLLNAYGPTECSDDVTHYPIYRPLAADVVNTPIGRPVMNMRIYVLDSYLRPVPVGVAGELYVGGVGVGRGYLHDPQRTAQSFIPHPFSEKAGARLYKTGDLARYLADGTIEFLGRLDQQVKIRGFRIELGEIEAALHQHAAVREAVVMAREDTPGEKRLVAYVVPHGGVEVDVQEFRSFIKSSLPEFMIPAAFVMLESLPLTPNGKIDRKSLPVPDASGFEQQREYVAPRTNNEVELAKIFAQLLRLEQISIHDNFFELGGHSLLATQLMSRVRSSFNVNLPLAQFFETPTVEGLAGAIEEHTATDENRKIADLLRELEQLSDVDAKLLFEQNDAASTASLPPIAAALKEMEQLPDAEAEMTTQEAGS